MSIFSSRFCARANEWGRWFLEATTSNMYATWGVLGDESKWITFRAMRMLALAGRLDDLYTRADESDS